MRGLGGKTCLVTGGGSGIGAATVRRLLEEGASVVAADINAAGLARIESELGGGRLATVKFDLADESSIVALVATAVERFGALNGVANVAADVSTDTMLRDKEVGELDAGLWSHVLQINTIGAGLVIRECLPHLVKAGGGAIVNVSSAAAWLGETERPAYAASKIALNSLTRHTARRWGHANVRCNSVAPGLTMTETVLGLMTDDYAEGKLAGICLTRHGEPKDLANAITFLLSDDAEWVTGQVISIDGGLTLRE
jgi:NAD(P)-dependent dehydrogenase (short-subunit alcohol dehydrogenase family)